MFSMKVRSSACSTDHQYVVYEYCTSSTTIAAMPSGGKKRSEFLEWQNFNLDGFLAALHLILPLPPPS
jgi:hypothetical protein